MTGCCFPVKLDRSSRRQRRRSSQTISQGSSKELLILSLKEEEKQKQKSGVVVCFGELLIELVPNTAGVSIAEAPVFNKAAAGAPAYVAVGIARLGGLSAFIGKVGDDEFGHMLGDILKENNVDCSGLRYESNARTGLSFVTLTSDGERDSMFYCNPSADMLLHDTELDQNLITKASIFHYGSTSLIDEPCKSAHFAALDIAKNAGCILSYDPNLRLPLWPSADDARKGILSIWNLADIIKVNEEEIEFLTEGEDPNDDKVVMEKLFHSNLKLLLVTEGSKGCRYYTQSFKGRVGGAEVEAVDTTGAGDAFVAGILRKLASNLNIYKDEKRLRQALHYANACAAMAVTQKGAMPALPTEAQVLKMLAKATA